jgi:hypothetical protein
MSTPLYNPSQQDVLVSPIFSTTQYGIFRIDESNRPIDPGHLEKIYDAINAKNLLREYPIVVDQSMTVIDGQHRLRAAEALGVPVFYIVSTHATIRDVAHTNGATKSWRSPDYLHYWCGQGKQDYLKLRDFCQRHPFLQVNVAAKLCSYGDVVGMHKKFKQGDYTCNDLDFAETVVAALLDFKKFGVEFYADRSFVEAVANLTGNADYDHQRMVSKMEYLSRRVVKCATMSMYIEMFDEIYNYNQKEKHQRRLTKLDSGSAKWRVDRKSQRTML